LEIINTFYGAFLGVWAAWFTSEVLEVEELSLSIKWIGFGIIVFNKNIKK